MKKNLLFALFLLAVAPSFGQNFGYFATAVWMKDSTYTGFFNTFDTSSPSAISNSPFINFDSSLGTFPQNSSSLVISGAEVKTFKEASSNVCGSTIYFTVYPIGQRPSDPVFTAIDLGFYSNCTGGIFDNGGGPCTTGDQKWQTVNSSTDLTTFSPGTYTLEVYYRFSGSYTSTSLCADTIYDNNNNNPTNYTASFIISAALPVTLTSFSGSYHQAAVDLNWTVTDEINEKGFGIERSIDGQTFTALSFVNALGNNAGALSYSYNDNDLPDVATIYYRLKMVNDDGKYVYSPVVPINIGAAASAQFTAALSSDNLTIHLGNALGNNSMLQLTDMTGRVLMKKALYAQSQSSVIALPLNQTIPYGVYIVSIYDGGTGNMQSKKVEANY
jgi:hypothetical protein